MPKPDPRTTYKYSEEFKATAVRLCQLPGVAVKDVAFHKKRGLTVDEMVKSP